MKRWLILFIAIFFNSVLAGCTASALPITIPASQPKPQPMLETPRVALVLGSGGARGYAHLGVLQALEEAHIPVDIVAGSSAGSIIAALYADNGSAKKTRDILMQASFWDFADISSVDASGVVHGNNLQSFLLRNMRARSFADLKKRAMVVATDIQSGKAYVLQAGPVAPAVLASAALPGVVKPVKLYGRVLIDGGVTDPVPVDLVKPFHPKLIIAVNLSRMTTSESKSAYSIYNTAYEIMWQRLTNLSLNGADIVINPDVGDTIFNLDKRVEMYRSGLIATRKAIPAIKHLLAQKQIQNRSIHNFNIETA